LINAAWGDSEAGALGTAKKKASVNKLAPMRNGFVILNGIIVFISLPFCLKFGWQKEIGRFA
jgi:hypothetical protein